MANVFTNLVANICEHIAEANICLSHVTTNIFYLFGKYLLRVPVCQCALQGLGGKTVLDSMDASEKEKLNLTTEDVTKIQL